MPEDKEKLARIKKTVSNAAVYINAEKNLKKLKAGKLGRIARLKKKAKTWAKEVVGGEKTYISKERHKEMVAVRKKKSKPKENAHLVAHEDRITL